MFKISFILKKPLSPKISRIPGEVEAQERYKPKFFSIREAIFNLIHLIVLMELPGCLIGKNCTCQCKRYGSDTWGRKIPWRNGNPLQPSCLGNPMDSGAWQGHKWVGHDLATKQQSQIRVQIISKSVWKHKRHQIAKIILRKNRGRKIPWRNGNPLQPSCLGNPTDSGAWQGHKWVGHDLVTKQ